MKENNNLRKDNFMNEIIRNRRGKVDLKYFSANKNMNHNNNNQIPSNIELNKI